MSAVTTVSSADVPVVLLQITTGENPDVKRDVGLILTQEDIINIKLYVKKGLSLPIEDREVISYIGYSSIGIAGLEPTDIKALFLAIKTNAVKWESLESDIKQQSINLDIFATRITASGDDIISAIAEMPIDKRIKQKVGGLDLRGINPDLQIPFSKEDGTIAYELKGLLEVMKKDVIEQKDSTTAIKNRIKDFRSEIATKIEPTVANKRTIIAQSNLEKTNSDLRAQISEKTARIEQLKKDYDKYVGLVFTGAPGGLIALAITSGIFGEKADKARKEKNQLIEENKQLLERLSTGESVEKMIRRLGDNLLDIQTRLIDAEQACEHLEFVWNTILENIQASLTAFNNVNDGLSLLRFKSEFTRIIDPWRKVKDYSSKLILLFDQALDAYRKQQGL